MTTLIFFFLFCQVLGAFSGVFAAIWGERAYICAMRDGKIDTAEQEHLAVIGKGLRFGMSLLLTASLALIVSAYTLHNALQPALTASYWIFITLALLIIGISWALSRRRISFVFGSAAAFAAWWLLAYLTLGRLPISFGSAVALYVVFTAIMYAVLRSVHFLALRKR